MASWVYLRVIQGLPLAVIRMLGWNYASSGRSSESALPSTSTHQCINASSLNSSSSSTACLRDHAFYAGGQFPLRSQHNDVRSHQTLQRRLVFLHAVRSAMMVYKYWDSLSITREDLEFSVGSKEAFWEVNDPHLAEEQDEDGSSERYAYPSAVPPMPPPMPSRYSLSNSGSDASECPGFRHQGGHARALWVQRCEGWWRWTRVPTCFWG